MVNSSDFAKRLEKIFAYYDLNASSFAEKIDVGRASISHLLSGRNKPSLDFVLKVVKSFPEVELYWLLNGKGNFPKGEVVENQGQQSETLAAPSKPNHTPTTPTNQTTSNNQIDNSLQPSNSDKAIQRVVIFYKDGTFEAFSPNN